MSSKNVLDVSAPAPAPALDSACDRLPMGMMGNSELQFRMGTPGAGRQAGGRGGRQAGR